MSGQIMKFINKDLEHDEIYHTLLHQQNSDRHHDDGTAQARSPEFDVAAPPTVSQAGVFSAANSSAQQSTQSTIQQSDNALGTNQNNNLIDIDIFSEDIRQFIVEYVKVYSQIADVNSWSLWFAVHGLFQGFMQQNLDGIRDDIHVSPQLLRDYYQQHLAQLDVTDQSNLGTNYSEDNGQDQFRDGELFFKVKQKQSPSAKRTMPYASTSPIRPQFKRAKPLASDSFVSSTLRGMPVQVEDNQTTVVFKSNILTSQSGEQSLQNLQKSSQQKDHSVVVIDDTADSSFKIGNDQSEEFNIHPQSLPTNASRVHVDFSQEQEPAHNISNAQSQSQPTQTTDSFQRQRTLLTKKEKLKRQIKNICEAFNTTELAVLNALFSCNGDIITTRRYFALQESRKSVIRDMYFTRRDDAIIGRYLDQENSSLYKRDMFSTQEIKDFIIHAKTPQQRLRKLGLLNFVPKSQYDSQYWTVEQMARLRGDHIVEKRVNFLKQFEDAAIQKLLSS
ncbi:hypothetical protein MP228_003403 [Amoeboaphelidium protococcarum]|nr:hypothetical protein MP228_003403 [Amoeboaphelidium protococcarum]